MLLQRLRRQRAVLHAVVCAQHRRGARAHGDRSGASSALEIGLFGAEPWTEAMRARARAPARPDGDQRLRPVRDRRTGRRRRVPRGPRRLARPGGSLPRPRSSTPTPARRCRPARDGELVFTPITKQALPLIRYRTGDIAALDAAPCRCGRTTVRMSRIRGRRDDMLIIRGVNLYPSEVERIVLGVPEVAPHYQLVIERPRRARRAPPDLRAGPRCGRSRSAARAARRRAPPADRDRDRGRIVDRGSVPRSEGKAVRVVDRRPR